MLCSSETYSGRVIGPLSSSQSQAPCGRRGVKSHGSTPVRTGPSSEPPRAVVPDSNPAVIFTMTEDCIRGLQKKNIHILSMEIWKFEGKEERALFSACPNDLISPQSREQKQAS